jgi:hypothetical protein
MKFRAPVLIVAVLAGCAGHPHNDMRLPRGAQLPNHQTSRGTVIDRLARCVIAQNLTTTRPSKPNLQIWEYTTGRTALAQLAGSAAEARREARESHDAVTIRGRLWVDYGRNPPDRLRAPVDVCLQTVG